MPFLSKTKTNIPTSASVLIPDDLVGVGQYAIVIGLLATNKESTTRYITIKLNKDVGDNVDICNNLALPPNVSFEFSEAKLVLEPGDELTVTSSHANSIDIVASLLLEEN